MKLHNALSYIFETCFRWVKIRDICNEPSIGEKELVSVYRRELSNRKKRFQIIIRCTDNIHIDVIHTYINTCKH